MRYRLTLTTPPEAEPVTLDEAKAHSRITSDDEDDLITDLITASRVQAENFTSRGLLPQTFAMYLDGFPGSQWFEGSPLGSMLSLVGVVLSREGEITIPRAPLIQNSTLGIDFIKYVDTSGSTQTLDPSLYQVDPQTDDDPVRIFPAFGKTWPATRFQRNAVTIEFQVGYADAAHVPGVIKLAIKHTVADWYENREPEVVVSRAVLIELPNAAKALLWDYRLF
jgi:hypothetical protein